MTGMRGAALLLVLWLVALLTALVGAYALTARIEALQGRVERVRCKVRCAQAGQARSRPRTGRHRQHQDPRRPTPTR